MAEYWHERVAAKLETELEEIVGDSGVNYWYTPDVVERTHDITRQLLNESKDVIYALAPFEVEIAEQVGEQHEETLVFDFMLARKHLSTDEPYQADTPLRWTEQTRLFGDFKKKILSNVTLDGLVSNVNFRSVQMGAEEVYVKGWTVVIGQIAPHESLQGDNPE